MIERILVSEIRKEITDFQEDIERLKNPEPPPLVKLSPVTEQKPVESVVSPEVMPAPIMTNSGLSHEDDTTRTSDATDSRSMCDVKSESGQFGWNDWTEEEENSLSGARMISARGKKLVKVKDEEQEANTTNHHQPRTDGFDIESEILPNFILNMKVNNNNNNNSATTSSEESVAKSKVEKKMRVASPVVKNEGYDEWSCIQKELASMTADHGLTTTTTTTTTSTSIKNELLLVKEPDLAERRFNELLSGGGEGGETKSKKSWMCSEQQLTTTTTTNRTSETCLSVHLDQAVGLGGSSSGTVPVSASVDQQQQHLHQTKQQTTTTTSNSSFLSCDPESWLDFQHNNNSFDFPMTANQGSAGTTTNHVDHHQQQQLTTNGHLDGSATTSSSTVTQKRPWNGILSGVNGDGGGVDDYYSKKMCYGNGDFDFNHLIMEGGANSQGSSLSNHCHDLQQSGSGGTGGGGGGLGMDQQSHHNNHQHHIQSQQQQQQQQQSHHPTFDEDINRQVQSAIDSILNLQSSDAADFQFNLDPAMGALLGDSTTENVRGGGGGGSSLNFTNHHHLSGGGTGIGGGLIGNHHHHNHHHLDGLSSANSSPSPSMMNSRFAMEGQQQLNQQNHNSHHHHQHNQQHISSVLQHSRQNPSSQMSSTMILSDDDVDHDDEDEDDEQRQAIKSVLLS